MKKALVFLADGFEEIEALTPVDYLRRAGVEVTVAAVAKANRTVDGAHGVTVNADITFDAYLDSLGDQLPDAVVVPGGMPGAKNIAECVKAVAFIQEMYTQGKLVTAICASPALVLSRTDALKNRQWTCYPGMQDNAGEYAASYVDQPYIHEGTVITGRGPGAAEEFSMEIVRTLCGEETAQTIKKASCQR